MVDKIQEANSLFRGNTSQSVAQTTAKQASKAVGKNGEAFQKQDKNNVTTEKALKDLTKKLEDFKKIVKTSFKYEILKKPHMIVIKVVNDENGEVIRQIPPKEAVKLAKAIDTLLGLFVDKHV